MRRQEKQTALKELWRELEIVFVSKKVVFGEGNVNAKLAVVGEAPGRNEEEQGHPFVGRAGILLSRLLADCLIERDKIWITNAVKWRPVDGSRNRTPHSTEIEANSIFLKRELEIISPKIVLCLGNVPARLLVKRNFKMNEQHGEWFRGATGVLTMATFHPAFVLRQNKQKRELLLKLIRDDFNKIKFLYEFYLIK